MPCVKTLPQLTLGELEVKYALLQRRLRAAAMQSAHALVGVLQKESSQVYNRRYYLEHKSAMITRAAAWATSNRDRRREIVRKSDAKARATQPRVIRVSRAKGLEHKRRYHRLYRRRMRKDPKKRLMMQMRTRLYHAVAGTVKSAKTAVLLGCPWEQLRAHLEKQFLPGMTWQNYGKRGWEVDHIAPCARFDLSDPAQQRACFHYSNLQPLWRLDNQRKGAR